MDLLSAHVPLHCSRGVKVLTHIGVSWMRMLKKCLEISHNNIISNPYLPIISLSPWHILFVSHKFLKITREAFNNYAFSNFLWLNTLPASSIQILRPTVFPQCSNENRRVFYTSNNSPRIKFYCTSVGCGQEQLRIIQLFVFCIIRKWLSYMQRDK
jgi:hypothetical protein